MLHSKLTSETPLCLAYIAECLTDFFEVVAADAALMEGLKQKGPRCWCSQDNDPDQLAHDLAYIASTKALTVTTIRAIQNAFALTQASTQASMTTECLYSSLMVSCPQRFVCADEAQTFQCNGT